MAACHTERTAGAAAERRGPAGIIAVAVDVAVGNARAAGARPSACEPATPAAASAPEQLRPVGAAATAGRRSVSVAGWRSSAAVAGPPPGAA